MRAAIPQVSFRTHMAHVAQVNCATAVSRVMPTPRTRLWPRSRSPRPSGRPRSGVHHRHRGGLWRVDPPWPYGITLLLHCSSAGDQEHAVEGDGALARPRDSAVS